jgi:hypothetical protein
MNAPASEGRRPLPEGERGAPLRKALTGDARAAVIADECLS